MRKGFTFIEMIFVIVIMGILAKFGSEIFRNVYQNYTQSKANNELQVNTELTVQQIANRLQYRIKDSMIAKVPGVGFNSMALAAANATVFEWVGYDIDGWLGDDTNTRPTWSGFIDVNDFANANANILVSPASDFVAGGRVDTTIQTLSSAAITTTVADAAIFFTGANSDVQTDYGWNGAAQIDQNDTAAHRVGAALAIDRIIPGIDAFDGVDIYEQYQLSWTAYALELDNNGTLRLYYDYQPWLGEQYNDGNGDDAILAQNVTTLKLRAIGDMINIQVCISENNITGSEYSICKEKAIF